MNKSLWAVAITGALTFSVNANADTYYHIGTSGTSASISYSGSAGDTFTNLGVNAGQFTMSSTNSDAHNDGLDFYAFCVDIFNNIQSPANYDVTGGNPFNWTATQMSRVNYLFDNHDTHNGSVLGEGVDAQHAGAFQLTLWEILNENTSTLGTQSTPNGAGLHNGWFSATGDSNMISLAEDWITDAWLNAGNDYQSIKYEFGFLNGHIESNNPYSQNLITWSLCDPAGQCGGGNTEIPEPAPLALLGVGLLGMLFKRKFN